MRTRLLLDEWFKDDRLAELSVEARLLFMGLHCYADREGRFEWNPKRIRAEIFPYDGRQVTDRLLGELVETKLLKRYEAAGHAFGVLPSFGSQKIHPHEKQSVIPSPSEDVVTCNDMSLQREPRATSVEVEVEVEVEVGKGVQGKTNQVSAERQVTLAPRIVLKASEQVALIAEFGERQVTEAAQTASDWLLAEGKTKKDYAAFLRNWLRRERETGRTAPPRAQFQNSRERNEEREALGMQRLRMVEESGAESLFHVGLGTPKRIVEVKK